MNISVDASNVDPWNEYLRERQHTNAPFFTREQYESQVNWMKGTAFESTNVQGNSGASGSNDPMPQAPKAPMATPLWATFENAKSARGNFHWNLGPKEREPVPQQYRAEIDKPNSDVPKVPPG